MSAFSYITQLQYRIKGLEKELEAFNSGAIYDKFKAIRDADFRAFHRKIDKLNNALAEAHIETKRVRTYFMQVAEDVENEKQTIIKKASKRIRQLNDKIFSLQRVIENLKDRIHELEKELAEAKRLLEEEHGKNLKLKAQMNRDYENSSIPSSRSVNHKKIKNSREKTGRKPGGQPGHKGHCRKKHTPTKIVELPAPDEVSDDKAFKKTNKTIVKQVVSIRLILDVTEYRAPVYYNSTTGERIHAKFPKNVVDDVNYDGSVKAFLYLLNTDCCTSIDKCSRFLSDLTNGELTISKGMINKLSHEFSKKSKPELKKTFNDLLLSPVLHVDATNARCNGKSKFVYVCAAPDGKAIYFARDHKGHEGIKGTVIEDYQGTLVHDHDTTFYKYGSKHQECSSHILRYLKDSMENEPDLTWNKLMHKFMQKAIHYRNSLDDAAPVDNVKVAELEKEYDSILSLAEMEYAEHPPSKYYMDGYNLAKRLKKNKKEHLLFLHDHRVPTTNNLAERCLRAYKRKQAQAVSFRSFSSIAKLCDGMSMLLLLRLDGEQNVMKSVANIFDS